MERLSSDVGGMNTLTRNTLEIASKTQQYMDKMKLKVSLLIKNA